MRRFTGLASGGLAALLAAGPVTAQEVTAFTDVSVVPMDRERVLSGQTVVVRDGRIAEVGPADRVTVPEGARRIDGRGRYLIPGLAEMHAHIPSPQAGAEWTETVLLLFVANGVTTIRGMLGHPAHLELRARAERGDLLAPRIWTSGPSVNGNSVQTPDSAVRAVRHQKAAGYDFIKIHPGLGREVFDSLDAAADRVGLPYSGHVPAEVGLARALEAGYASIDHLDGYVEAMAGERGGWFGAAVADRVDDAEIREAARRTREAGVWNVPTQTLMESYASDESGASMAKRPEMRYLPAEIRSQWIRWKENARADAPPRATLDRFIAVRRALLLALQTEGAGLLLGSDAPQVWNVPGFSVHRELDALVAAGLTPYQALATGTVNVARFFGVEDVAGTIAPGKSADLVLLEGNPLEDIRKTARPLGVMVRGGWLSREEIAGRLAAVAARYAE